MAKGSKIIRPGEEGLLNNPIPRTKRLADITNGDYYPTAPYMMMALLENERFVGDIGEFACGGGHIATTLTEQLPNRVVASDLFDRGYGTPGVRIEAILAAKGPRAIANTITNPPYARNVIEKFIRASVLLAQEKCALLMRLQALEGDRRQKVYQEFPLARIYVFVDRPTFYVNRVVHHGDMVEGKRLEGTHAYAWYVWDRSYTGSEPVVRFLPKSLTDSLQDRSKEITAKVEGRYALAA